MIYGGFNNIFALTVVRCVFNKKFAIQILIGKTTYYVYIFPSQSFYTSNKFLEMYIKILVTVWD